MSPPVKPVNPAMAEVLISPHLEVGHGLITLSVDIAIVTAAENAERLVNEFPELVKHVCKEVGDSLSTEGQRLVTHNVPRGSKDHSH